MLLIFDLDGTIIDTREEIMYTFRRAFENLGLKLDEERMERNIGLAVEELIEALLGYYDERVHREIRNVYLSLKKRRIRVFPGIKEVLTQQDFKKAIFTSKKRWVALRDLEYVGLRNIFPLILGADDVSRKKPAGEGIERIMELAGERRRSTYVIGDTEMDILAARDAGVKSIAVTWGFRSEDFLRTLRPDFIARKPGDILTLLKKI